MGGKLGTIFARAGHEVTFSYARSEQKLKTPPDSQWSMPGPSCPSTRSRRCRLRPSIPCRESSLNHAARGIQGVRSDYQAGNFAASFSNR